LFVDPGSPAAQAGILPGDLIEKFQNERPASVPRLQEMIAELDPGMLVSLETKRKLETRRNVLALEARPFSPLEKLLETSARSEIFPVLFGFRAESTGTGLFSEDFIITKVFPGSGADEAGLSENDPFTLRRWQWDKKARAVIIQMAIKKRKTGFLEGEIQLGAYIDTNSFI
jgi:serine protease Do